ncbi:MAG: hypothetical protein CM1200mP22_32750 [Dehalococcoidia bacterium]|nr:MAG: hypothetical protein CM1200mP22_32750 [Dehalococcoidia bacterium]
MTLLAGRGRGRDTARYVPWRTYCINHTFHSPGAEAARDDYPTDAGQMSISTVSLNVFRMNPLEIYIPGVSQSSVSQGFTDRM